ncbi:MAG TPA: hypothetical protein VEH30_12615 [Terriglobales bacterium]|nr:hypothetical protein [Terriglobales bacterium]
MAAIPNMANPYFFLDAEPTVSEERDVKPTTLLERSEELLRKAFGDAEETIASSLRGL